MNIKVTYDKSVDAAYIYLKESRTVKTTDSFEIKDILPFGDMNLDFDENNLIVGIEILNASKYLAPELLEKAEIIG